MPFAMPRGMRRSAIDKQPVDGPVAVGRHGLVGDEQYERRFHGGARKAVHAYSSEDLDWWSEQLGIPLPWGFIGENLTTADIDLNALFPTDELHVGSVVLRVTEPRDPCSKLAARVGVPGFERRFRHALRTGVYAAVERPGVLRSGDPIVVVSGERSGPSIRDIVAAGLPPGGARYHPRV